MAKVTQHLLTPRHGVWCWPVKSFTLMKIKRFVKNIHVTEQNWWTSRQKRNLSGKWKWWADNLSRGRTIDEVWNARKQKASWLFSFDMLGEAALTQADADRYLKAYPDECDWLKYNAKKEDWRGCDYFHQIRLHPRYEIANVGRFERIGPESEANCWFSRLLNMAVTKLLKKPTVWNCRFWFWTSL